VSGSDAKGTMGIYWLEVEALLAEITHFAGDCLPIRESDRGPFSSLEAGEVSWCTAHCRD
jgi:hypothetical protein